MPVPATPTQLLRPRQHGLQRGPDAGAFLSDDLLESIAWDEKVVMVRGAAWLSSDTGKPVGVNSLSSRMLCGRHNRALSPQDKVAADYFRY
jgi:hypothetical protein